MIDVLVIGSGPAGLSAAVYAKRANLDVLVAEKVYYGTGQIAESNLVDNYLGFAGISGYDLGEKFREHAVSLGVEFKDGDAVGFEFTDGIWKVTLKNGDVIETRTVIYAAGAIHRHLGVSGEKEFSGKGGRPYAVSARDRRDRFAVRVAVRHGAADGRARAAFFADQRRRGLPVLSGPARAARNADRLYAVRARLCARAADRAGLRLVSDDPLRAGGQDRPRGRERV